MPDLGETEPLRAQELITESDAEIDVTVGQTLSAPQILARWKFGDAGVDNFTAGVLVISGQLRRDSGSGNIIIALLSSDDNGVTWTAERTISNNTASFVDKINTPTIFVSPDDATDIAFAAYNTVSSVGKIRKFVCYYNLVSPTPKRVKRV